MTSNRNLPLFLQNNMSGVPLWNKNAVYIDKQKLYQLEIFSDDSCVELEKDVDDILNINTSKCDICNINVPTSFIKEHLTSDKHKTFSKIANIALNRTQKQLTTDMFSKMCKLKIEVKGTYFCNNCSVVVNDIDKDKHKMSEKHVNCVKNDTLFRHLVDIYEEPQKCFEGDENILSVIDIEKQQTHLKDLLKISNIKADAESDEKSETSYKTDTDYVSNVKNTNIINKTNQELKATNAKNNPKNKATPIKYNNDFDIDNATNISETLSTDNTPITTTSNENSNVKKGQQNAQKTNAHAVASSSGTNNELSKKNTYHYEENLVDLNHFLHIAKFLHKDTIYPTAAKEDTVDIVGANFDRIRVPLENFHGYHVVGQAVVCKVCPGIETVDGKRHKWTDVHMKSIMLPLTKQHLRQISETTCHCVLCNTTLPTTKSVEHTSSTDHVQNLKKYKTSKELTQKIKQIAIANCLKWTQDSLFCRLCQFNSEKTNDSINQHVTSNAHKTKIDAFLVKNKILKMPLENGCYWCGVCQKKIGVHLSMHCISFEHKKRLANFVEFHPFPV